MPTNITDAPILQDLWLSEIFHFLVHIMNSEKHSLKAEKRQERPQLSKSRGPNACSVLFYDFVATARAIKNLSIKMITLKREDPALEEPQPNYLLSTTKDYIDVRTLNGLRTSVFLRFPPHLSHLTQISGLPNFFKLFQLSIDLNGNKLVT